MGGVCHVLQVGLANNAPNARITQDRVVGRNEAEDDEVVCPIGDIVLRLRTDVEVIAEDLSNRYKNNSDSQRQ